jgi:hypothetical protein
MKLRFTLLFTTFLATSLLTINAEAQKREKRNLTGFNAIQAGGSVNVYLTQGNTESVEVEASEDVSEYLITEVKNGTLELRTENNWKNWFSSSPTIKIYVTFKELTSIASSGGSDVYGQGTLKFDKIHLQASGGADIELALNAKEVDAESSGGADIELEGNTEVFNAHSSGGSNIKASELKAAICDAESSGGSDIYLYATKELNASASGGSDIYYSGSPANVNSSKSGGGSISRR